MTRQFLDAGTIHHTIQETPAGEGGGESEDCMGGFRISRKDAKFSASCAKADFLGD